MPKEDNVSGYLYTVYRNKNDEIICFECPAKYAAAIMGISKNSFFNYASLSRKKPMYTIIKSTGLEEVMAWDEIVKVKANA